MLQRIAQTVGRIVIILLVAGAISGGVYVAANAVVPAGQVSGFGRDFGGRPPRAPRTGLSASQNGGAVAPAGGQAPDPGFGGPRDGGNRNSPSLARGLPDLLTNIVVIGVLIWGVSLLEKRMKRRKRRATVQAVS